MGFIVYLELKVQPKLAIHITYLTYKDVRFI